MATTPLPPNPGALKFGWLNMLNISVRNCRPRRSEKGKFLKMEKSRRWKPGPGTCVTPPKLANVQLPTTVQGGGSVKAPGLPNQLSLPLLSVCSPKSNGWPVNRAPQPRPCTLLFTHERVIG